MPVSTALQSDGLNPHGTTSHTTQGNPGTYSPLAMTVTFDAAGAESAVYTVWQAAVSYQNFATTPASNSQVYISNVAGNLANDPTTDSGANWRQFNLWTFDLSSQKAPCRAVTAATMGTATMSGTTKTASSNGALGAVNGVTLSVGDRVLDKDDATGAQRGIFVVTNLGSAGTPWVLTRALDADTSSEFVSGAECRVTEGTQAGGWYCSNTGTITLGSTALTFNQATGTGGSVPTGTDTQTLRYNGTTLTATSFVRNSGTQFSVGAGTVGASVTATVFGTGGTGATPAALMQIRETAAGTNAASLQVYNDTQAKGIEVGIVGTAGDFLGAATTAQGDVVVRSTGTSAGAVWIGQVGVPIAKLQSSDLGANKVLATNGAANILQVRSLLAADIPLVTFAMLGSTAQPAFWVELMDADSPSGTGARAYEFTMPLNNAFGAATWTVLGLIFRVSTTSSSGLVSVNVQYSTGSGIFSSAGNVFTSNVAIGAGSYETTSAGGNIAVATLTNGNKVRLNIVAAGATTGGWSVLLGLRRTA